MPEESPQASPSRGSVRALQASNFFLADVQTGLGPFLTAYLASAGWNPGRVGLALTVGGIVTVLVQTPAGAIVDHLRAKRTVLIAGVAVLAGAAVLLFLSVAPVAVYGSQVLIGAAGPFLAPTLGAITLGLVGRKPLLLVGFGVLPMRALLYTLTHRTGALIAIQVLDGVANAIFGVVAVLVAADRTRGTGRFNLVQGALATAVGIGAALSTTVGGKLIQYFSYRVSFLALGGIAVGAFLSVMVGLPETVEREAG